MTMPTDLPFRFKNTTPFPCGRKVTSTRPPRPEMVVVVRGRFDLVPDGHVTVAKPREPGLDVLAQGPLMGDLFPEGDDDRSGAPTYASDFADLKPRGEVLFRGHCHPPGGRATDRCPVSLSVGPWQKALWVVGDRTWASRVVAARPSAPAPFQSMPITWERAFGGPGFEANPVGRGLEGEALPNIEGAAHLIASPRDRPTPAGFGPLSPEWAFRASKRGRAYDKDYQEKRAPYYSEDFDWTHFNAAPSDQWIDGYFRGDEELQLVNLHPDHPRLVTRLPGHRIRCFVRDVERSVREVPMVLDTVFIDGDAAQVLLTWRGRTPVADPEMDDVTSALVVEEPLDAPPTELATHRETLERFEDDPLGFDELLPPEEAAILKARAAGDAEAELDATVALLERESPGVVPEIEGLGKDVREELQGGEAVAPAVPMAAAPRVQLSLDPTRLGALLQELEGHDPSAPRKWSNCSRTHASPLSTRPTGRRGLHRPAATRRVRAPTSRGATSRARISPGSTSRAPTSKARCSRGPSSRAQTSPGRG